MKINLFIYSKIDNSAIIDFCNKLKKLKPVYQKVSEIDKFQNQNNLIILNNGVSFQKFINKFQSNVFNKLNNTCFFLSNNVKLNDSMHNFNIIKYPIKFVEFENKLIAFFKSKKNTYENLELVNDNKLINNENSKQVFLTEIESKIVLLLFNNEIIDKGFLNQNVLNQSPSIDSKSLESHIYRLRKKFINIESKKKIIVFKSKGLKLV